MSDVVIKVENLSKLYRYGQSGFSRASLREALTDAARSTVQGAKHAASTASRQPSAPSRQPICNPIRLLRALRALRGSSPCPSPSPIRNLKPQIQNPLPRPLTLAICNLKSKICNPKTVPSGPSAM